MPGNSQLHVRPSRAWMCRWKSRASEQAATRSPPTQVSRSASATRKSRLAMQRSSRACTAGVKNGVKSGGRARTDEGWSDIVPRHANRALATPLASRIERTKMIIDGAIVRRARGRAIRRFLLACTIREDTYRAPRERRVRVKRDRYR